MPKTGSLRFCDLFKSYLSQRLERVISISDSLSASALIKCGVSQGFVFGPVLFILYVNDNVLSAMLLKCVMFADDNNLLAAYKNLEIILAWTLNFEL